MIKNLVIFILFIFISNINIWGYEEIIEDPTSKLHVYYDTDHRGKYGFMNMQGEIVIPAVYYDSEFNDYLEFYGGPDIFQKNIGIFTCGLAIARDENRGYGFVNDEGIEVIPCQYKNAFPFNNGLAAVQNSDNKWGYINTSGELVVPLVYDSATLHRENRAFIEKNNKLAFIDNTGKILTDFVFERISGFPFISENRIIIKKNGEDVCVDGNGKVIFKCVNIVPSFYYSEGLIPFSYKGENKTGLLDENGNVVLKPKYAEIKPFKNGVTVVSNNNLQGVINKSCKELIPVKYPEVYINPKDTSLILVRNDLNKYGFLNHDGKVVIPFKFDVASTFNNNIAGVGIDNKYGYINSRGEQIIPLIYDNITLFDENGYAAVMRGSMWSVIDAEQKPLIPYVESPDVAEAKRKNLGKINGKSDVDINIPRTKHDKHNTAVLIIANEKYSSNKVGNVLYAKNDGKSFNNYCKLTLGIPENNIMLLDDATLTQLKTGIKWLQQKANISDINKVLVYYAGHGVPDYSTAQSYILPSDGNPLDLTTAFSLSEFYNQISLINTRQCLVFIDACFSGMDRRGEALNEVRGISIKPSEVLPKGNVVVLSACQGDEIAQPFPSKHHGVFSYYLLKYLQDHKGDGTVKELNDFLKRNVMNTTLTLTGKVQTPTLFIPAEKPFSWEQWEIR